MYPITARPEMSWKQRGPYERSSDCRSAQMQEGGENMMLPLRLHPPIPPMFTVRPLQSATGRTVLSLFLQINFSKPQSAMSCNDRGTPNWRMFHISGKLVDIWGNKIKKHLFPVLPGNLLPERRKTSLSHNIVPIEYV